MKQLYPTFILNTNDESEHPFLVCVPDMEIFTEGDTFADAIEMARATVEKVKRNTEDIDFSQGVVTYVDVDFSEYRKKVDKKLYEEM